MPLAVAELPLASLKSHYEEAGFVLTPAILPLDLVQRAVAAMDAVIGGTYETRIPPQCRTWNPGDHPGKICKIDNAQVSNRSLLELVSHPAIGRWAAQVTGARRVQVWSTQLLFKPPGGEAAGNVGWHQDQQYWPYWQGEVFTAWIALSDVTPASGPVRFVRGSHHWGQRAGGNFFDGDLLALRDNMNLPEGSAWDEAEGELSPGAMSFHHCLTIHGSGPNRSAEPRRSMALHLRTEKSSKVKGVNDYGYATRLDDPGHSPILFDL